ncbi:MAG: tetratricopeptide repeat protein [Chitinophagales bacterium]|nr:tetratricopeptide repeat protein [Chitinophagales bacterium]MDW8393345.1 tetratricopeptide repeat protein [Chitinophagales bacterium]
MVRFCSFGFRDKVRHAFVLVSVACLLGAGLLLQQCGNRQSQVSFRNLSDTARYVGMQTCRGCHEDIYQTFIQTGMGRSWGLATPDRSAARFTGHEAVYDSFSNFWYRPYWVRDSLYIEEYRLSGTDTVYRRREQITHIVGSGQHTNSHLWWHQGYLCQAPITFYTQKGIWDLAPGFEGGRNSRWQRTINMECMTCHNMFPEVISGAENKYAMIKSGIECERCHGPGSIHVAEKLRGIRVDTSRQPDYSIVNPRRLPRELQMQVCMRCHLQGITVLNEGKTFADFRPGMMLSEVMQVFMPRYAGDPPRFIMASHVDRLKQSLCYQRSPMTCLTCHNPHVSVTVTPAEHFNKACNSCHGKQHPCSLPVAQQQAAGNRCYSCHMPVSETLDIPHVTVHDHRIRIPLSPQQKDQILQFVHLECLTTDKPSPLLMAQGYLQAYEAFAEQSFLLDSADFFLRQVKKKDEVYYQALLRLAFLKKDYEKVVQAAAGLKGKTTDAWTAYRLGEAYYQLGRFAEATAHFRQAVQTDSLNVQFLNKYGSSLMAEQNLPEARQVFHRMVSLNDRYAPGWGNLGYVLFLQQQPGQGRACILRALELDPDYEQAWINLAAIDLAEGKTEEARRHLMRVLQINPQHEQAKVALLRLMAK